MKKAVVSTEKPQSKNVATEKSLQNEEGAKTSETLATSKTPEVLITSKTSEALVTANQSKAAVASVQTKSSIGTQTPVKFSPNCGKKLGENEKVLSTPKSVTSGRQGSLEKKEQTPQATQEEENVPEDLGFSQVEKEKVIAALNKYTKDGFLDVKAFSIVMNTHTEHNVLAYEFFSENRYLELRKGTKSKEVISFCEYFKIKKSIIEEFLISYHLSEYVRKNLGETASEKDEGTNKIMKVRRKLFVDD